ncbi:hypothetical protein HDU97_006030 [Phlyctochytrium planicorne]|nr:hypothetical protein HDU97_006030 [Phlyctochytrium planicorne]
MQFLIGLWQLSSPAWGSASKDAVLKAMKNHYDAGFRIFGWYFIFFRSFSLHIPYDPNESSKYNPSARVDMADHCTYLFCYRLLNLNSPNLSSILAYVDGNAEAEFRKTLGDPSSVKGYTKWCPSPGPMTRPVVEAAMRDRLVRMGTNTIECLQFHWWDYSDMRYLDALLVMKQLKEEGMIQNIALTNFDTIRLEEIIKHGIPISSNQVQYSIIDLRPDERMAPFCEKHGIKLLTYGTFCGGFVSDKYLNAPAPTGAMTPSQRKYLQMIQVFGGWNLFQELLRTLKSVSDRHNASIANVATRFILERPAVGAVIIGTRLGLSEHIDDNKKALTFSLGKSDYDDIERVLAKSKSKQMFSIIGDCGDEYRR